MSSPRNKTIDFSPEEGNKYTERCLAAVSPLSIAEITDKTVLGSAFDALKLMPEGAFDLVIADPPYNMDKEFGGLHFKSMPRDEYIKYTENWLALVKPLMKTGAGIYVCCNWQSSSAVEAALEKFFTVRNRITWQREKGRGSRVNWKNACEDIWFATNGDEYTFNACSVRTRRRVLAPYKTEEGSPKDWEETPDGRFRDTAPSNFWDDITVPYWSMTENTAHPTQKPEKLLAKLILASSNEGDMVLDPFAGSGSTAVTAKKLGRHYTGIEINPQYCAWAEYRLEMADTDARVQGYEQGVFWERNSLREQKKK